MESLASKSHYTEVAQLKLIIQEIGGNYENNFYINDFIKHFVNNSMF